MTNTTMIVDGNNLLMRSIHATAHAGMAHQGIPTGPLTVFISSLTRLIRDERPTHLAVAWDSVGPGHRHAIDAEYKANRRPGPISELKNTAFPQARQFLKAARISQLSIDGYEADDIIANWWRMVWLETAEDKIVIASSDKDFLQLLGSNPNGVETELVRLSSADTPTDRWNLDRLQTEMGFEPEDWPKVTALTGDASDNVIGLAGIGPKKAAKLLTRYNWVLDEALGELSKEEGERVLRNFEMVNLISGADLSLTPPPVVDFPTPDSDGGEALETFFERFALKRALNQFLKGTLWVEDQSMRVTVLPGKPLPRLW